MINYRELRKIYKSGYNVRSQNEAGMYLAISGIIALVAIVALIVV